jgi:hypothetical protein
MSSAQFRFRRMPVPIVVLVGAGASYASGPFDASLRPPLTRELFQCQLSGELLKTYSLARNAGRRIERDMEAGNTLAFEQALLRLRQSSQIHRKQMSAAVPPYLQALLLAYSSTLEAEAQRYETLVDELLSLETRITFVSLNYDTLLDNCLNAFHPLIALENYIDAPQGWSLVKPHGSVAWYVEQGEIFDPTAPRAHMTIRRGPIKCEPVKSLSLSQVRGGPPAPHGPTARYPAIALPEGPKDELVVPPGHLDHLRTLLHIEPEVDLLVLGYSAIDTEILQLVIDGRARIRRMTVVNASPAAALGVYDKIEQFGIKAVWPDVFDGSYERWIDGEGLRIWISEFDGPYPSVVEPAELRRRIEEREREEHAKRVRRAAGSPSRWSL